MPRLSWLTARPVAHRGLHDAANGIVENTPGAARAAIAGGYSIECDVQISSDGEAMVFHDDTLERLTDGHGALAAQSAAELTRIAFKGTSDRMASLGDYCDLIAERAVLVIELKSRFDGDLRIAARTVATMRGYKGAFALMSFDPALVAQVRRLAPDMTRGIVSESNYDDPYWKFLPPRQRAGLAWMTHAPVSRPQFIAHNVEHLPAFIPQAGRALFGIPILTWTVRSAAQRARAARIADQMIFEGFRP